MPNWNQDSWHDRVADWFEHSPVLVTVACSLGSIIAAMALQEMWTADAQGRRRWHSMAILLVILILTVTIPALVTERTKTLRGRRTTIKVIQKVHTALAQSCGYPDRHVRVNVMLPDPSRHRRRVDAATAFNMAGDADHDLEIGVTAGVSGLAWMRRKGQIGDLTIAPLVGGPDWGLTEPEQKKVRATLKTVLSVPIFDPNDAHGPLVGTLQVDSDHSTEELGWNDATVARAQTVADVVGLHIGIKL
jgi:hypothetical protein